MKLKYILPVVALSGIATIAMPLVTSCNGNGGGGQDDPVLDYWDFKQEEYESRYTPLDADSVTRDEMTETYYNKLVEAPDLYCDDLFTYINNELITSTEVKTVNKATVKADISNISLIEREAPGTKVEANMISATFNVTYDLDLMMEREDALGKNSIVPFKRSFTAEVKNFKMWTEWVKVSETEFVTIFRPVITSVSALEQIKYLKNDTEWLFTAIGTTDEGELNFEDIDYTKIDGLLPAQIRQISNILALISPKSHYLSNLTQE